MTADTPGGTRQMLHAHRVHAACSVHGRVQRACCVPACTTPCVRVHPCAWDTKVFTFSGALWFKDNDKPNPVSRVLGITTRLTNLVHRLDTGNKKSSLLG